MKPIVNRLINLAAIYFLLCLVLRPALSLGGEIYKWVDEEGTVHMTDYFSNVPPQYRNQFEKKTLQPSKESDERSGLIKSAVDENARPAAPSLKRFGVPYQAFEGTSRRIIIPVTLNESVTARLLLDTGSPGLLISPKLATQLGLLNEQDGNLQVMANGIGGSIPAILAIVDTVQVGEARAEFLPATITQIPSNEFEGLVGMDLLANYRVSIDTNNNVVYFNELPPRIDRPGGHDETWWRSNFQRFAALRAKWNEYLGKAEYTNLTSSETDRISGIIKQQYEVADKLYRKLERFARDNAVPVAWRD